MRDGWPAPGESVGDRTRRVRHSLRTTARLRLERLTAGLVTLVACEGATTVVERGDEPLGLVPAFLLAGAGAVVASLWPVDQRSAAHVMEAFYRRLLAAEGVIDKAEALRAAALSVRAMPQYATPYHWAPFTLHGSWR